MKFIAPLCAVVLVSEEEAFSAVKDAEAVASFHRFGGISG
jgi:hypothetical protein